MSTFFPVRYGLDSAAPKGCYATRPGRILCFGRGSELPPGRRLRMICGRKPKSDKERKSNDGQETSTQDPKGSL